jgi:predicted Zn-dependent protease
MIMPRRRTALPILALLLSAFAALAAVPRLVILSPEHERAVGAEALKEVEAEFGFYTASPALSSYLDALAAKLGAQSRRRDLAWNVKVLDTGQVYAFPLPAGTICVSRGLVTTLSSEGEMAAALACEMAHVALRHDTLRVQGADLAAFLQGTFARYTPELSRRMDGAVGVGLGLALCGFATDQEKEADAEALVLIQRAGYDPACAISFYKALAALEEKEPGRMQRYLAGHLPTGGRLEKASLLPASPTADCGAAAHRKAAAGLPLGKSTKDAFFAEGIYIHRALRIRLEAPPDFDVNFAPPDAVLRLARTVRPGDAVVPAEFLLEVLPAPAGATPDSAVDAYVKSKGIERARQGDRGFKTKDGRPLALRIFDRESQGGVLRTFLAAGIEGEQVYILRGTAHIDRYKTDFAALLGIIQSFRILSPEEAQAAKEPKVAG